MELSEGPPTFCQRDFYLSKFGAGFESGIMRQSRPRTKIAATSVFLRLFFHTTAYFRVMLMRF